MTAEDDLLLKISQEIYCKEQKIIDDYAKCYLAIKSLDGISVKDVFDNYNLIVERTYSGSVLEGTSKFTITCFFDKSERVKE